MNPRVYNIPPGAPFAQALAQWIVERFGGEAGMAGALVLLPSRRACRSLREAFLAIGGGRPMLLPRIQPIGDLAEEGVWFAQALGEIPAAISPTRRHLLLARLILRHENAAPDQAYQVAQAAGLARQLADLLDEVQREGLSFDKLADLVPEALSQHWQHTLDFLRIIALYWPRILQEEGLIDTVERRTRVLQSIARAWAKTPPPYPVIAAGSTGSQPATAALLAAIAGMEQGAVVLPGLDAEMPQNEWDILGETYPQFGLKQLLKRMGCARNQVSAIFASASSSRISALRAIFQPPQATARWAALNLSEQALAGVRLCEADSQQEEARMIAVALRETLEMPGKTAALITPDRTLARLVMAEMQRFGIALNDSGGQKLLDTPPGCFMRLLIDAAMSEFAPVELLALLRHPLCALGFETAQCRALSRELEIALLRGIRHTPGLRALHAAADNPEVKRLLANLMEAVKPLALGDRPAPLSALLSAHIACAEALAATDQLPGPARLWAGEEGAALAAALAKLMEHADALGSVLPFAYGALFGSLLAEEIHRPAAGLHPRLSILSPIEARMQHYDLVILGALNEGTWPALTAADPWMSRPMRDAFGLPAYERAIGQSAHDVFMLCAAPEVLLTRARKMEGAPAVASRWLVRLKTLMQGREAHAHDYYGRGQALMNAPATLAPISRPEPLPPLGARPKQLSVTAVDAYVRDPYMIYAKYILALKALPALDEDPDMADFGQLVHRALEQFAKREDKSEETLLECGRVAFSMYLDRPAVAAVWWPRFEAMAKWVAAQETIRLGEIARITPELEAAWEMGHFTLTTRIDRLEERRGGELVIVDYKTGALPAKTEIERGLANQLAFEALVVLNGKSSPSQPASSPSLTLPHKGGGDMKLEYWKLSGDVSQCEVREVEADLMEARARLEDIIRRLSDPQFPYGAQADPSLLMRYNDYAHLTRRAEWEEV